MEEKQPLLKLNEVQNSTTSKIYGSNNGSGTGSTLSCECDTFESRDPCTYCLNVQNRDSPPRGRQMSITVLDSGEHCHDDELLKNIDKKARKKLLLASLLCVIFMIAESVGGILAGSLAVATDAAHLLTDFAGFMISLFALYIAERPATKRLSYGYHRAEVIGALTSVLLIWVVTGILVFMAVQRILNQQFEIDAPIMLITSGVGLIVNILMGCTLHQHAHSHGGGGSHGHSHGGGHGHSHNTAKAGEDLSNENGVCKSNHKDLEAGDPNSELNSSQSSDSSSISSVAVHKPNINVRAAYIHVIGDFIQSVGVFIAAIVIYFKPTWVIIDPICTFVFSILVLATTYAIVKDAIVVLMEGIPKGIDFNEVRETLLKVKGVCKVHNLRIWSLSMDRIALSSHLAVDPKTKYSGSEILRKSCQIVKTKYGFSEVTIQIEDFNERMQDCVKCQELN